MMNLTRRSFALLAGAGLLQGCASAAPTAPAASTEEAGISPDAGNPISFFDMHCDTIDRLGMGDYPPYSVDPDAFTGTFENNSCEVSVNRMGAMRWAQCYAIWLPDEDEKISHIDWYRKASAFFKEQMEVCSDVMTQARSFDDVERILDEGKVAAILTVENAACLEAGLEVVDQFAEDGVMIAGFTWNGRNVLGSGNDTKHGLTKLGRSYLAALEEHGIVADVSHLNEEGFWKVEELAKRPYIATHSNSRAVCDVPRNLTDDQFRAIVDRGGLVGLNLHKDFVYPADGAYYDFDRLYAHIEHWLDLGGQDVIAFGTDRDGSDISSWIAHCSSQEYACGLFTERMGEELAHKLFFDNAKAFFERYETL